ncbi:FtsH-binding integral membrane protein [Kibdelosporangium phytohabitans]|nr:FtsH-binding integral membrane protein [Kibdelosporangium phytohabitans]
MPYTGAGGLFWGRRAIMTYGGGSWQQPGYAPYPPGGHVAGPRVKAGVLVGVTVWRLLIAAFAFTGFGAAVAEMNNPWPGLSQQASLLAGVVYLGLALYPLFTRGRRHEPRSPWLRGATAVLLLLVGVTFMTIMEGDLDETWSLFEHLLTPLAVLVDWVAVGRNQADARWWHPLTWVVFPLAYLLYFLAASVSLYGGFLDPDDSDFIVTVLVFLVAVVATGYLLYGIAKLKGAIAPQSHPVQGYPVYQPHGYRR